MPKKGGAADLEKAVHTSAQEIPAVSTAAPEMSSHLLTANDLSSQPGTGHRAKSAAMKLK